VRCAHLTPEHLADAAKRIERAWEVVVETLQSHSAKQIRLAPPCKSFEVMARPYG
jgi:hypothetical protein